MRAMGCGGTGRVPRTSFGLDLLLFSLPIPSPLSTDGNDDNQEVCGNKAAVVGEDAETEIANTERNNTEARGRRRQDPHSSALP
jgi:hypothetical protein